MIQINAQTLRSFSSRKSRFDDNFLVHYPEFNGTWSEFLELDKIRYDDKMWLARRVLNRNQLTHFAILCAQSVLSIYENKYPDDKRVSDLINFMITIVDFSNLTNEQQIRLSKLRSAAYAAAYNSYNAYDDAYDAAYAAYAAAYNAYDDYDDAYDAAYNAANAAYSAAYDTGRRMQQELNISFLKIVEGL